MPHDNRRVIRNPVAQAAILRKGGVHDKSTKAKRKNNKQALKRQLREGRADRPFFMVALLLIRNTEPNDCLEVRI